MVRKVGCANYEIEMSHRRKKRQIYHVNLLKKWETPSVLGLMVQEVDEEEFSEVPDWKGEEGVHPDIGTHLASCQRTELIDLLEDGRHQVCWV